MSVNECWTNVFIPSNKLITDSMGFKNEKNSQITLNTSKKRLLFIGDSFTEGAGLNFKDSFVGIIKKELKKKNIEVLNASRVSYSPTIYYRKIKHLIEVDKLIFLDVIVFLDISDVEDDAVYYKLDKDENVISREKNQNVEINKKRQINKSFILSFKNFLKSNTFITYNFLHFINNLNSDIKFHQFKSYNQPLYKDAPSYLSLDFERDKWTINENIYEKFGKKGVALNIKYMNKLKNLLDKKNINLIVAVYPWPTQIYYEDLDSRQVQIWSEWTENNNVKFLNYFPLFVKKDISNRKKSDFIKKYYFDHDFHFNKKGNM